MLLLREEFEDSTEGLHSSIGVKGRDDNVTGLRCLDRNLHGLEILDFSYEEDVRRLAERIFETLLVRALMLPDFLLGAETRSRNETTLRIAVGHKSGIAILDGIFDRNDVSRMVLAKPIENCRQSR